MELCLVTDHACNLRCSYCYTGHKNSKAMTIAMAEQAIEFALARDPRALTLSFFGGEPLLHLPFIEQATAFATRRLAETNAAAKLTVHLNTNGTLVSARVLDYIAAQPVVNAFVSLDGPAKIHDRHRVDEAGRGTHAATRRGLEQLAEAGANVFALAVVSPDVAAHLGDITEELFSLPLARAHVTCNLRATWDTQAIAALRAGLRGAAQHWKTAFRAGKIVHFEPLTTKVLSHLHAAMPCGSRCQFALEELVVAPSGRFYSCGELVGEDQDERLSIGALATGIDTLKLATMRSQKDQIETHCEDCEIRERCSSSCGCKHVALTGSFGNVTTTLCDTEAAFIEAADEVAEELYKEGCEAFLDFFYRKRWAPSSPSAYVQLRRKALSPEAR